MKKAFSRIYLILIFAFLYAPLIVMVLISFNSGDSTTQMAGFSLKWYAELINNVEVVKAVYVSVSIAIIATIISTILGTITAIGLSRSRKVLRDLILNINNIPILNPEIVTAIGLMLLFSSIGMRKGYVTMLIAHISFCTPYVITSVYPNSFETIPRRLRRISEPFSSTGLVGSISRHAASTSRADDSSVSFGGSFAKDWTTVSSSAPDGAAASDAMQKRSAIWNLCIASLSTTDCGPIS